MISYAQNFEDVMLARALRGIERGFYVDIGAWHPERHSVTRHFYESGWSGINVEPGRTYFALLSRRRRRDVNLNIAVSDHPGRLVFHETPRSGLSGTDDSILASAGHLGMATRSFEVEAMTLCALCERHVPAREIHFLKIDVEGHEPAVLRGGDWKRFRPWILVIEAVTPAGKPAWPEFEPFLLAKGYVRAWFDGLNCFYVREESGELLQHFLAPPNVFDGVARFPDDPLGRLMERSYGLSRRIYRALRRAR